VASVIICGVPRSCRSIGVPLERSAGPTARDLPSEVRLSPWILSPEVLPSAAGLSADEFKEDG